MKFHIGTDVGGTFTDLWVLADDGRSGAFKAPTTADIVSGVVDAIRLAAESFEIPVGEFCRGVERFGHGTTVGLNALLTDRVGKTAIITTSGFGDTLEIGRLRRQYLGLTEGEVGDYLRRGEWPPLVPRDLVEEVPGRMNRTGEELQPLDEARARAAVLALAEEGVEAVAICTLWATENPAHELRLRELVREAMPDVAICASHEVSPTVGEYGRMTTTAANAALQPVAADYLDRLEGSLQELGVSAPVLVMTGAGGVVSADYLTGLPVATLLSGPVAGVIGCGTLGRGVGRDRILTVDIGGTSFDVGLIVGGEPVMSPRMTFGGADIRVPCVDVRSIGAGGGSIAFVRGGDLSVGPQSAGADPGPACYGRGGTQPTATDADLILGVLDPGTFVGGRMSLDVEAAERAIHDKVARPLGIGLTEAAWGIREVLDNRMADLLRQVTIERGHDPREFVMFAGGGSGPSHAWVLARELGVDTVVVPAAATAQSAYGTGTSDIRVTGERPVYLRVPPGTVPKDGQLGAMQDAFDGAMEEVLELLPEKLISGGARVERTVAVRYRGQAHHLDVPFVGETVDAGSFASCLDRFEGEYETLFGKGAAFREAGFEVTAVRAIGTGSLGTMKAPGGGEPLKHLGSRKTIFEDPRKPLVADVYAADYPKAGQAVEGPCVVEFPGSTLVVPPGSVASSDKLGNLQVRSRR